MEEAHLRNQQISFTALKGRNNLRMGEAHSKRMGEAHLRSQTKTEPALQGRYTRRMGEGHL
ncbi:hypothetical protein P872_06645 [Rhodonellum psychrophilum GCM71 = DSM 17998]|uniref:Uncharacterized protein n=1 Tax=Rhodonellum psychrophilum GCM71 = DSM 17998 TaxID=1123057 RepID=U5C181_9BACT|nr:MULTISPECIES: hypothetical protein [Rhodonellum]ERM82686.1 hypothetical protein P872_06645 [Rhodonellum psychrophilum GCM71 = DSM 17998]